MRSMFLPEVVIFKTRFTMQHFKRKSITPSINLQNRFMDKKDYFHNLIIIYL